MSYVVWFSQEGLTLRGQLWVKAHHDDKPDTWLGVKAKAGGISWSKEILSLKPFKSLTHVDVGGLAATASLLQGLSKKARKLSYELEVENIKESLKKSMRDERLSAKDVRIVFYDKKPE